MSMVHAALPPLAIPTRTRSTGPIVYPTTPLSVFPPPAPSVLPSMHAHDRRSAGLTVRIDNPFKAPSGPWSPKGHVQPHRSHLPRRRNPKPCFQNFHAIAETAAPKPKPPPTPTPTPKAEVPVLMPTPTPTSTPTPASTPASASTSASAEASASIAPIPTPHPPKADEPHLQAIIPALWVAFSDSAAGTSTNTSSKAHEDGFTHIVEIAHSTGSPHSLGGSIERRWDAAHQAQRLRLLLPPQSQSQSQSQSLAAGRAALALTDGQLRAARDFVGECLPPDLAAVPEQTAVRVLVAVPPGRPTDAMCVVGCYLGFVAERGVEEILRYIDEEDGVLSVWKGEVSGEEVERVEEIARSWSWLRPAAAAAGK